MVVILLGYAWGDWAFGLEQQYLINIFPGSRILEQKASQPNHTSHRKVQFYEFVQIFCVVTWAQSFLSSVVMEAVRGQKHDSERTLWHFNSTFGSSHSASSAYKKK